MKLKLVVSLLVVLSLFGATARAQETPKVDIFVGYSFLQANPGVRGVDSFHLHGGNGSIAYNAKPWVSVVADFGGYNQGFVPSSRNSGTLATYLFGPRVSYRHFGRFTPFGQVLIGAAHANRFVFSTAGTQNAYAMTAGGGVDFQLFNHFAIRAFQSEYLLTRFAVGTLIKRNQTENNLRVSTGFVFRF
jgi:opacity protein-like surface antigen